MLTYKAAGVDIDKAEKIVDIIKKKTTPTFSSNVLTNIGGFSGLFTLKKFDFREPVLVSGTDGVGTKLKIAFMLNKHNTIGIDAVAMCVNDVITSGAIPLFFLDYLAVAQIETQKIDSIISGIAEGCLEADTALIGGETAEMPGFYADGEYDIAGFCVGIVEKDDIIDGRNITQNDVVLALNSSGLHSNGFSLVREVLFKLNNFPIDCYIDEIEGVLGDVLLTPTKIYAKIFRALFKKFNIKGIANITGGGIVGNIQRILPEGLKIKLLPNENWKIHPIFSFIEKVGNINKEEMFRVFNMGVGMAFIIDKSHVDDIQNFLLREFQDIRCFIIGNIET